MARHSAPKRRPLRTLARLTWALVRLAWALTMGTLRLTLAALEGSLHGALWLATWAEGASARGSLFLASMMSPAYWRARAARAAEAASAASEEAAEEAAEEEGGTPLPPSPPRLRPVPDLEDDSDLWPPMGQLTEDEDDLDEGPGLRALRGLRGM